MSPTLQLRVTAVVWKSEPIRTLELRALDRSPLPPFTAGAHIDVHLPTGLVRSYSLMNDPAERNRYLLGIARDPQSRGGSTFIHDNLHVGNVIRVGTPRNLFELCETARASVLIGGGIGVTPLVSMAARLARLNHNWTLHYAVRSQTDAAFVEDLAIYGDRVRLHRDDEEGRFLDLSSIVDGAAPGAHFYCCGPTPMMRAFTDVTRSIDPANVHVEHFSPIQGANSEGGYLVELAKSGLTVAVPQGSTILEALANIGIAVPNSCQQGVCGTCEVPVLAGQPDHRDSILTRDERAANDTMMICCSGSLTERLVLDL